MAMQSSNEIAWKDRKHWLWFPFSFTKYEVDDERLYVQKGFFSTSYDETLLYRIVDIRLVRSLGQKLCGTGTILVSVRVDQDSVIELKNIKKPMEVKRLLSKMIENVRNEKKVVGKEFYGIMGGHHVNGDADDMDADSDGIPDHDVDMDGDGIPDHM